MRASAAVTGAQRLLARAVDVLPGERRAALLAFAYFFALLASYYVLRPVREEMGIRGGIEALHWTFTATFAALAVAVPVSSALFARVPRDRAVPLVYRFFLVNILAFAALFATEAARVAVARTFFVWLSVFNLLVVAVFWSFMADLFTSEQAKRLFGFVAAGGSLGAMAGSAAAGLLVGSIGIPGVLLLSAALLEAAARCAASLAGWARGRPAPGRTGGEAALGGGALSGVVRVFRSPYLAALSVHVLLFTLGSTFLYFQQARIVRDAIADPARRTALFAAIDLAVNVAAFAIQSLATGRIATAFGLGPALAAVPVLSGAGFLALAAAPSLGLLASFQTLRRIGHYGLERPARDVLYTVVSREEKYKSKAFIDTVVYRGGDALAAWAYAALAALGLAARELALAAVPAAAASLAVALWLSRRERSMERP